MLLHGWVDSHNFPKNQIIVAQKEVGHEMSEMSSHRCMYLIVGCSGWPSILTEAEG